MAEPLLVATVIVACDGTSESESRSLKFPLLA